MPECRWLDDAETLTYLHGCVSTKRHHVRLPETPIYLDALLADQPLTGGLKILIALAIGEKYQLTITAMAMTLGKRVACCRADEGKSVTHRRACAERSGSRGILNP